MKLRPYRPAEAAALFALFQAAVLAADEALYPQAQRLLWADRCDAAEFAARLSALQVRVAENGQGIIGFCAYDAGQRFIDLLYVAPQAQGQGVGRALLDDAMAALGRRQAVEARASLCSLPLFLRCGFQDLGRRYSERGGLSIPYHAVRACDEH